MKQGWEEKELGTLCNLSRGHNPPKSKFINEPRDDYVRFYQIRDGWSDDYVVYVPDTPQLHKVVSDDFLMVAYRHIGKVFRGVSGAFNVALCKISNIRKDILNNDFLFYMIPTDIIKGELMKRSERSLIPSMSVVHLKKITIPLPPLPEQKRIVAILDKAFAAIAKAKANAEQNLKNAKELFESYLHGVFENKGKGWKFTKLKHNIDLLTGFAFRSKYYTSNEEDILLLRGDNIMQGKFRWKDAKRWKKSEYYDFEKYQLQENDIVLAMDRPWVNAGLKCSKVSKIDLPSLLVQRTACLRNNSKIDNSFLYYLIKSKGFMDYLLGVQTGIGVPHISGKQILGFTFNRPAINKQQTIVKKLDALSAETKKLEAIYQQKIEDLEELKKSVLQKAFNGEL